MQKYGFSGLTQNLDLNIKDSQLLGQLNNLDNKFIPVRVTDIILDSNHPKFNNYGGWNSIGIIEFELLDKPSNEKNILKAYPYLFNIKSYPLVNEIVQIFRLPDRNLNQISNFSSYYYLPAINIWNNQHHNAYPNPLSNKEFSLNSPLNKGTFEERSNIHPILPFAGDNIFEGRFGNSIRLGSTVENKYNEWSSDGKNGDPITIIRNGQPLNSTDEAWVPQVEDINNDLSSMWFTSTQKIPIKTSYENFSAFEQIPIFPRLFNKPQIILNSDRIVLNTKKDGLLLSGQKFVSINSSETVGINAKKSFVVNSLKVNLGDKNADQQLILGNKLLFQLEQLTISLINTTQILEDTLRYFNGGLESPHPASIPLGIQKDILTDILNVIKSDKLLSKVSRTI